MKETLQPLEVGSPSFSHSTEKATDNRALDPPLLCSGVYSGGGKGELLINKVVYFVSLYINTK